MGGWPIGLMDGDSRAFVRAVQTMTIFILIAAILGVWCFMAIVSNEWKRAEQEKRATENIPPVDSAR